MLIIELQPLPNGAHDNNLLGYDPPEIPNGWAVVPKTLEEKAISYLPFINLDVMEGEIVGVSQGPIPYPEPVPMEEPDPQAETDAMLVDLNYRLTLLELGL